MMKETHAIFVRGRAYNVYECAGYVKASMDGIFGWSSVWAEDEFHLLMRIVTALDGEQ
jgi:hypothetical protein